MKGQPAVIAITLIALFLSFSTSAYGEGLDEPPCSRAGPSPPRTWSVNMAAFMKRIALPAGTQLPLIETAGVSHHPSPPSVMLVSVPLRLQALLDAQGGWDFCRFAETSNIGHPQQAPPTLA